MRIETEFEIVASTTASILQWIERHPAIVTSGEAAQIEIGWRVKSAMLRAVQLNNEKERVEISMLGCGGVDSIEVLTNKEEYNEHDERRNVGSA